MSNKKSAFILLSSGLFNVILGIGVGFLLPKFLNYQDYSYYRIFMFYIPFYNLLHLGFADGIYRLYGAYDMKDIKDDKVIGNALSFFILYQVLVFVVMFVTAILFKVETVYLYIIVSFIILNMNTVFRKLFSCIKEFKFVATFNILQKLSIFIAAILLFAFSTSNYHLVVIFFLVTNILLLIYEFYFFRNGIKIKNPLNKDAFKSFLLILKSGFAIMFAYFLSYAILGLDRFFIEYNYSLVDYAIYSFAYSVIAVFLVTLNSLNSFIYPLLSRVPRDQMKEQYRDISFYINTFFTAAMIGVPLIIVFIRWFLPDYVDSIPFFIVLVPVILFQTHYSLKFWQFYNLRKDTKSFILFSIIGLAIGFGLNMYILLTAQPIIYYAYATIFSLLIWIFLLEIDFNKHFKIVEIKTFVYFIVITIGTTVLSLEYSLTYLIVIPSIIVLIYGLMYFKKIIELFTEIYKTIIGGNS